MLRRSLVRYVSNTAGCIKNMPPTYMQNLVRFWVDLAEVWFCWCLEEQFLCSRPKHFFMLLSVAILNHWQEHVLHSRIMIVAYIFSDWSSTSTQKKTLPN